MFKFPSHKVAYYKESHSLFFNEAIRAIIEREMLGCQALLSRAIVSSCLVLILQRQLENYLLSPGERVQPDSSTYLQDFT